MTLSIDIINMLRDKATQIRINSLQAIANAKSGHPGGSLSIADILSVLYFHTMQHDPKNPTCSNRDYCVVSKGHSSPAVYSTLGLAGYINLNEFVSTFRKIHTKFQGHIDRLKVQGVEISTGSLGHGLSNALGISLGLKLDNKANTVFAILSDGELQEGQTWEAIMAAGHYQADNLIAIVDRNNIQLDGFTEDTMKLNPLDDKFKAFGWNVEIIDGHDIKALCEVCDKLKSNKTSKKPSVIIANTIKGKGVSFMENQVGWHGVAPSESDLAKALQELT